MNPALLAELNDRANEDERLKGIAAQLEDGIKLLLEGSDIGAAQRLMWIGTQLLGPKGSKTSTASGPGKGATTTHTLSCSKCGQTISITM